MDLSRDAARQDDLLSASRPAARSGRPIVLSCGFLLLAIGLVFGQTVRHAFVNLDDNVYVYENPHVARGLTVPGFVWAFSHSHVANWHPLTWISLMLDCQLYGLHAGGHHLTNVLLHAATAILLLLVLRRMTGDLWPSVFVAALFAIHPLRVESVAWVTERKDVLSGLFFLLTIAAYVRYVRHPFSLMRYLAVAAIFFVGLMTKPMLVTLPLVLLLLDYWPLGRFPFRWHLLIEKLPLFALAAVSCALTLGAQGESLSLNEHLSLSWRIGNALISYVAYLGHFLYPVGLAALYPRRGPDLPLGQLCLAILILAGITAAAWIGRKKSPYLLVGWLWYLVMMAPVIGVVLVGLETMADRFTYLPQIGLGIALAYGAADAQRFWSSRRSLGAVASALVLAIFMSAAWRQTSFWADSQTLWTHTLACTSQNSAAHNAFANALVDGGRPDDAIDHYRRASAIRPTYAAAHFNLGVALAGLGRLDEAVEQYRETIAIKPDDAKAQNNLGNAFLACGQLDRAMAHCREALKIDPDFAEAHYNLGNALFAGGRLDEAMAQYRSALDVRPDFAEASYNLGLALMRHGHLDQAIAQYRQALAVQPDFAEVHNSLGLALAASGQREKAAVHYRRALEIRPGFVEARNNLSRVLAGRPRLEETGGDRPRDSEVPSGRRPPR
jgi:tetratricopeptide (TPR) repeat protein